MGVNADRRARERLAFVLAAIMDALQDAVTWLRVSSSERERLYVLAMNRRLANLAVIAERRMKGRALPRDRRVWSEFVTDVLSLIEKAREVRGNIVGQSLGRLAGHLPKELPGRREPKLAAPKADNYEIEARELQYKNRNALVALPTAETKGNEQGTIATSSEWRSFQDRFMRLAGEEQGRADVITKGEVLRRMDKVLRAFCSYREHPEGWERGKPEQGMICLLDTPPHGVWNYGNGISENFRERVRLCVAEAGRALPDYPEGADPEDFWLHRLYLDLLKNNSDLLFCGTKEGGMILSVCVASTTFCARLQRQALQVSELGGQNVPAQPIGRHPFDQNENFRNGIRKKKARIELERLSQPLQRAVSAAENSEETAQSIESKSAASSALPASWEELRNQTSISQRQAAQFLKCDPRTVRRRLQQKELSRSRKGRIVCNEQLRNQIRRVHGEHVLR